MARGELDRHLRRMRAVYRERRDILVEAARGTLPEADISGIAAGLRLTVALPDTDNETAIRDEALRRGVRLETMGDYEPEIPGHPPTLMLGYGQMSASTVRAGVDELAIAVRAARTQTIRER